MDRVFVGITGGSGHAYADRLICELVRAGREVAVSITPAGCKVLRHELGVDAGEAGEGLEDALEGWLGTEVATSVSAYRASAVEAPPSSGTSLTGGVVICPCSMGTLARAA
ncbi:MAG: flavoprotein, partial [Planctomycetota bacterium]